MNFQLQIPDLKSSISIFILLDLSSRICSGRHLGTPQTLKPETMNPATFIADLEALFVAYPLNLELKNLHPAL
jgi:hypothetical protein